MVIVCLTFFLCGQKISLLKCWQTQSLCSARLNTYSVLDAQRWWCCTGYPYFFPHLTQTRQFPKMSQVFEDKSLYVHIIYWWLGWETADSVGAERVRVGAACDRSHLNVLCCFGRIFSAAELMWDTLLIAATCFLSSETHKKLKLKTNPA